MLKEWPVTGCMNHINKMPQEFQHKEWIAPDNSFTKRILTRGYGFHTPQDGSLCKVHIISDESNVVKNVDCDNNKELVVGDVDEPIERIIESCVRTMKEEEICLLKFPHPSVHCPVNVQQLSELNAEINPQTDEKSSDTLQEDPPVLASEHSGDATETDNQTASQEPASPSPPENELATGDRAKSESEASPDPITESENLQLDSPSVFQVQFQLLSYSREPEIWEMSVTEKWRRATYHKQKGMELYARGEYQWAFYRFGLTLKYIISLEHDVPSGHEEGMNMMGLKLSSYLNVAACQIRHHNYPSVVKNCSRALQLQPDNAKALYRRGAAYVQLQEYEKAKQDLTKAHELEPKNPAIIKQQQLLKAKVQKLNQYYASAMKKMFS